MNWREKLEKEIFNVLEETNSNETYIGLFPFSLDDEDIHFFKNDKYDEHIEKWNEKIKMNLISNDEFIKNKNIFSRKDWKTILSKHNENLYENSIDADKTLAKLATNCVNEYEFFIDCGEYKEYSLEKRFKINENFSIFFQTNDNLDIYKKNHFYVKAKFIGYLEKNASNDSFLWFLGNFKSLILLLSNSGLIRESCNDSFLI